MLIKPIAHLSAIQLAMVCSVVVHMTLLAVDFRVPDASQPNEFAELKVILVNNKSLVTPTELKVVAQMNLNGGGNTNENLESQTNLSESDMLTEEFIQISSRRIAALEEKARNLIEALDGVLPTDPDNQILPIYQQSKQIFNNDSNVKNADIARLRTKIAKDWLEYQKMPKRDFVGAQTTAVIYAEYVEQWIEKIEEVGTKNFPRVGGEDGVYGSLLVTVSIRSDGSLEEVRLDRESGHHMLDQAVKKIVRLSSPFLPFPQQMKQKTDILSITRNWRFTRSDLDILEDM